MDITDTLAPKSDQLDAVDLAASGPQTFTITRVDVKDNEQQPVNIHLAEFPRPWRPNKNTRRILGQAWGPSKGGAYEGRRVTLYYDPDVEFGGSKVGGVRIAAMSHLPGGKPFSALILPKKGRSETVVIKPLPDAPTKPTRKAAEPTPATDKPTGEQMVALGLAFTTASITDSASKARYITETLGRELNGWDDLTAHDVETLTDALKAVTATVPAEPEGWDQP